MPDDNQTNPLPDENAGPADDNAFADLQSELEQTKSKLAELTTISQQALADLQNYKKRTEEEKSQFILFANANLITQLLAVLDNLDRALKNLPAVKDPATAVEQSKEWTEGIAAIAKQLSTILLHNGLSEIVTLDQTFDPKFHEAVMTKEGKHDHILQEVEKGYLLGDRVLRRAKVIVGNGEVAKANPPVEETPEG